MDYLKIDQCRPAKSLLKMEPSEQEQEASVKIQKVFRGYLTRKNISAKAPKKLSSKVHKKHAFLSMIKNHPIKVISNIFVSYLALFSRFSTFFSMTKPIMGQTSFALEEFKSHYIPTDYCSSLALYPNTVDFIGEGLSCIRQIDKPWSLDQELYACERDKVELFQRLPENLDSLKKSTFLDFSDLSSDQIRSFLPILEMVLPKDSLVLEKTHYLIQRNSLSEDLRSKLPKDSAELVSCDYEAILPKDHPFLLNIRYLITRHNLSYSLREYLPLEISKLYSTILDKTLCARCDLSIEELSQIVPILEEILPQEHPALLQVKYALAKEDCLSNSLNSHSRDYSIKDSYVFKTLPGKFSDLQENILSDQTLESYSFYRIHNIGKIFLKTLSKDHPTTIRLISQINYLSKIEGFLDFDTPSRLISLSKIENCLNPHIFPRLFSRFDSLRSDKKLFSLSLQFDYLKLKTHLSLQLKDRLPTLLSHLSHLSHLSIEELSQIKNAFKFFQGSFGHPIKLHIDYLLIRRNLPKHLLEYFPQSLSEFGTSFLEEDLSDLSKEDLSQIKNAFEYFKSDIQDYIRYLIVRRNLPKHLLEYLPCSFSEFKDLSLKKDLSHLSREELYQIKNAFKFLPDSHRQHIREYIDDLILTKFFQKPLLEYLSNSFSEFKDLSLKKDLSDFSIEELLQIKNALKFLPDSHGQHFRDSIEDLILIKNSPERLSEYLPHSFSKFKDPFLKKDISEFSTESVLKKSDLRARAT